MNAVGARKCVLVIDPSKRYGYWMARSLFPSFPATSQNFWIILNSPLPCPCSLLPILYLVNSSKVPSGENLNGKTHQRHLRFSCKTQLISSLSTVVSSYFVSWSEVGDQNLLQSLVSELAKKSIDSTKNQFTIYYCKKLSLTGHLLGKRLTWQQMCCHELLTAWQALWKCLKWTT